MSEGLDVPVAVGTHNIVLVDAQTSHMDDLCIVRRWFFAGGQYSSLCGGAVVNFLDAVDIGEDVLVRVQVG